MEIRALIVDDEAKARESLQMLISQVAPDVKIIGEAQDVASAVTHINAEKPDLVFLDVEMPGGTGFDLLEKFDNIPFKVIFTTAYGHYAIRAIRFSAMDYLLKPIDIDELRFAIAGVRKQLQTQNSESDNIRMLIHNLNNPRNKKVAIPDMDGITFVKLDDIVRCEADRNYTVVHLNTGRKLVSSKALKEYEKLFQDYDFLRLHHSHLINLNHVKRYLKGEGGTVVMSDESQVDVSRRRKSIFLDRLSKM